MRAAASPLAPIQRSLYQLLSADSVLSDLGVGIHDEVDEDTPYPYIRLGESTQSADNSHDRFGRSITLTLHVWSGQPGPSEALAIEERVVELLDHQALDIEGPSSVKSIRFEFSQQLTDPNPPHPRHTPIRFRITTEQPKE